MLPQDPIELKVKELLSKGEKTEAIKFFKENSGLSFQESKSFIESIERSENAATAQQNNFAKEVRVEYQENRSAKQNQVIANFIELNKEKLPTDKIHELNERLNALEGTQYGRIRNITLKNPTTTLILSIFFGAFGADRFILNDYIFGSLKFIVFSLMAIMLRWTLEIGLDPLYDPEYSSGSEPPAIFVTIYDIGNHYNLGQYFFFGMIIFLIHDIATAISRTRKSNYKTVIKQLI